MIFTSIFWLKERLPGHSSWLVSVPRGCDSNSGDPVSRRTPRPCPHSPATSVLAKRRFPLRPLAAPSGYDVACGQAWAHREFPLHTIVPLLGPRPFTNDRPLRGCHSKASRGRWHLVPRRPCLYLVFCLSPSFFLALDSGLSPWTKSGSEVLDFASFPVRRPIVSPRGFMESRVPRDAQLCSALRAWGPSQPCACAARSWRQPCRSAHGRRGVAWRLPSGGAGANVRRVI